MRNENLIRIGKCRTVILQPGKLLSRGRR
jgi:hypothetical protein